jgi:hypothetical protein
MVKNTKYNINSSFVNDMIKILRIIRKYKINIETFIYYVIV